DEASKYLPLEELAVSPQCGFSSTLEGNEVAVEDQRVKLALCAELARENWGRLYPSPPSVRGPQHASPRRNAARPRPAGPHARRRGAGDAQHHVAAVEPYLVVHRVAQIARPNHAPGQDVEPARRGGGRGRDCDLVRPDRHHRGRPRSEPVGGDAEAGTIARDGRGAVGP